MALPTFKKHDEIPEAFRGEYEEKDGEWKPKPTPIDPNVISPAAQAALDKERQRATDEEKARKKAEKDLADLKRAADARDKGITDDELQKIRDDEAKARKPLEDKVAQLEAENRKLKLDDKIRTVALDKGIMKDRLPKAMKDLEGRIELTADGTGFVVKDATGKVTTETLDQFFEKTYRTEAPFFYQGPGGSGGGAGQSGDGGGSEYDAVAAGKKAAEEQKKQRENNALAFK